MGQVSTIFLSIKKNGAINEKRTQIWVRNYVVIPRYELGVSTRTKGTNPAKYLFSPATV